MRRNLGMVLLVVMVVSAVHASSLGAEEGALQRFSPFRFFRTRPGAKAESTHARVQPAEEALSQRGIHPVVPEDSIIPRKSLRQSGPVFPRWDDRAMLEDDPGGRPAWVTEHRASRLDSQTDSDAPPPSGPVRNGGWLGYRSPEGRPPTLEELRAHLESRGVDPARLDAMAERAPGAWVEGGKFGQTGRYGAPAELAQIRAELESRGVDAGAIEARIAERTEVRENHGPLGRQGDSVVVPHQAEVRSRLERGGLPPAAINARFGTSADSAREGAAHRFPRGVAPPLRR
jgi:hypothetical protein